MPEATGQLLKMLKENNYKPRIFYPMRAKGNKNKKESKGKMFSDKRKRKELITKRPALHT